jgi:chemotaxis protein methyltransferase CheR
VRGSANPELRLSDLEFRRFAELLRGHCGLHFAQDTRFVLEQRIGQGVRELGIDSFSAYHHLLRSPSSGVAELLELVDELTTNETYFFRERRQLDALVREILPEAVLSHRARGAGPVQIWSAGCSSGEEPYSVVMLGLEAGFEPGRDFRVHASDISRRALSRARRGQYREASFRETEPELRERYFENKEGAFQLDEKIRALVDCAHLNLFDEQRVALLPPMDVILCRNVLIYFYAATKQRVIDLFERRLVAGGHLLLGHAESLLNLSTAFELRSLERDLVYRRPLPGHERFDAHALAAAAGGSSPRGGRLGWPE